MKSAETSLRAFGAYLITIPGLGLILVPAILLDLFMISYGEILWPYRMIGMLALLLGVYYFYMAKYRTARLYPVTVVLRYIAGAFMIGLWAFGEVEVSMILFASVDIIAASWTWVTLPKA